MAKRRKAVEVTLTPKQRDRLERLWFYYGNYGPKSTPGNHGFIQGILEHGVDERPLRTRRTPKSEIPTPECERAVDEVLSSGVDPAAGNEGIHSGGLRVVSSHVERPLPEVDPEMKEMLDDMNRRYRVMRERLGSDDDTPEAA
jgi:hypothetical protein